MGMGSHVALCRPDFVPADGHDSKYTALLTCHSVNETDSNSYSTI